MPPMPTWDSVHPLTVHFPIALLLIAPLFVVLAMLVRNGWRPIALAALVLMAAGAGGAVLAVASGEAGEDAANGVAGAKAVLERHEDLAELARNSFIGLALAYGAIISAVMLFPRLGRRSFALASVVFLGAYGLASVVLVNAAHEGGLLVHRYGVHASMSGLPQGATRESESD